MNSEHSKLVKNKSEKYSFEFKGEKYFFTYSSNNLIKQNDNNDKFKSFFNIFFNQWLKLKNYFTKKNILIKEKNKPQTHIPEDHYRNVALDKEIKDMINNGWIKTIFKYIEEGYELKEEDCLNLAYKLWDTKYEYQKKIIEDIFLNKKLDVKYQAMFFFLLHINSNQKNFEKEMLKKSQDVEFTQYVKHYWVSYLQKYFIDVKKSSYVHMNFHWRKTLTEYSTVVLKNISQKELIDIQNQLIEIKNLKSLIYFKYIEEILTTIQNNSCEIIENEIIQNIDFIKNKKFKNNQHPVSISHIPNQNDLSKETQEMLNDLEVIYKNLINQNLTEEELFQLQNISKKRIPEIIQKFLSIDPDYRLELKNSKGQTAEEMMNDSLIQLREHLKNIQQEVNENKFKELTVTHQYIKTMNR